MASFLTWPLRRGELELDLLAVDEVGHVVGGRDEGVVLAVGDEDPPELLLVVSEVRTVDRVRNLALAFQSLLAP